MSISQREFELLRNYISKHCGIQVGANKSYLLESRLTQLMLEVGASDFSTFYHKANADKSGQIREKIVDAMTTNETLWFRDTKPWKVIEEKILPDFGELLKSGKQRKVRVWSAASSTGQEPYSLAILIDRYFGGAGNRVSPSQFEILGTDISPSVLFLAKSGRYNQIAMSRGMEAGIRDRYFKKTGPVWMLDAEIKRRVAFQKLNLQDSFRALGKFDMIFCRNVAIYFADEFKKDLFKRLAEALNPGGILFLGSSETLMGISTAFKLQTFNNVIYYVKA